MKKKLLILLTFFLGFSQIYAQNVNVNSSSSMPSTPLDCNDLIFTVNGIVNCINFPFDSTSYTVSGSTIEIGVYYSGGLICAGALNPYSHNVNVGMIPQGNYSVVITGYLNLGFQDVLNAPNVTVGSCCGTAASFTSNKMVGCTDDTNSFIFTNTSTGSTSNQWYLNGFPASTATDFSIPSNIIGSYVVSLVTSNGICSDSTVQTFEVFQSPTISLGNDTTSCIGSNFNIIAPSGFSSYSWTNNSSMTNTATVTSTDTYTVTAIDINGCSASDNIEVFFNTVPVFSLGPDTTICSGESVTFDAGSFDSYSWNTSETTQTITVNSSFNYVATVTDANNCSSSDAIAVLVNNLPNVSLGPDTFEICSGNSVSLSPGIFSSYLWSTTETSNSIDVSIQGVVTVTATDANNCSNSDDTYVKVNSLPMIDFGGDTLGLCEGSSLTLNPGSFNSYIWNTTDISSTLNVNSEATYSVSVTDGNNCSNTGAVFVEENDLPNVDLGLDQDLCSTDKLVLSGGNFASYTWNDGSSMQNLEVNGADFSLGNNTFSLSATDENGCINSDEIVLNVKTCDVGISSLAIENSISVFPNPVKDVINIKIAEKVISDIVLYNLIGKKVILFNNYNLSKNSSIDISELNEGIYFIEITINNQRLVKQFIKRM